MYSGKEFILEDLCMELKLPKKININVCLLITYVIVFGVIAVFRFQYTSKELSLVEKGGNLTTSE